MDTTSANVAVVTNDFMVEKSQQVKPAASQFSPESQLKNKAAENQQSRVSFTREEIASMTQALNEYTQELNTNLGFSIREGLNRQVVVEIKNTDTHETIKQFPPEELLEIKEKMAELVGLIFDVSV